MQSSKKDLSGMAGDFVSSLVDKQGQLDLELKGITLEVRGLPLGVEVNGLVTVSMHMRELTDEEKKARSGHVVATLAPR
jgi:hypothetical protein